MASSTHTTEPALSSSPSSQGVAAFISKVWSILKNSEYKHLISWSESGKNVIVHDYPNFSKNILPHYFKHNNFNSFVRQLNLYGFRKVTHPEQGVLSKVQVNEPIEFWHHNFRKGHPELLHLVQRRPVNSRISSDEKGPELSKVLTDIHQMKGKQENIGGMLDAMRQDNIHLKRELELLKERHTRQQRILNKIIQFLIHMVYKGRLPTSSRRRPDPQYLMLTDSDSVAPPAKRGRVSIDPPPSPTFTFSDSFRDLTKLPIEASPTVEPIPSVIPPILPINITSPPTPPNTTSLQDAQYFIDPAPVISVSSNIPDYITTDLSTAELTSSSNSSPSTTLTTTHSPTTSLIPAIPTTTTDIATTLLSEFNPFPEWNNLTGHIDSHQQELDSLPDFLSSQLCMDSTIINQFLNIGDPSVPEYDAMDTARLLETLSGDDDSKPTVMEEYSPRNAITQFPSTSTSPSIQPPLLLDKDEPASSPGELLELFKDTLLES